MKFIFEEDFRCTYKSSWDIVEKEAKVFVVDEGKQLSLFKDNEVKLVQIGVMQHMGNRIWLSNHYGFHSPNPQINDVYNRTHNSYEDAKFWALKHLHSLDWDQILEEGV